jgi:hypothetical protein
MPTIEELYTQRCLPEVQFADIHEHMPTLRRYAAQCSHITEIGTRTGNSTTAFLAGLWGRAGGGVLHSYDRDPQNFTPPALPGVVWKFHRVNTHEHGFQPEPTDLLFVDGDHTYGGVSLDLRVANIARKWVILHDTAEAWIKDGGRGVFDGLADFLRYNPQWVRAEHWDNCNGLTILERAQALCPTQPDPKSYALSYHD